MNTMKRNLLSLVLGTLSLCTLTAANPILSLSMEMDEDGYVTESVKNKPFTVRGKHADNVDGVVGKAIRMD